MSTRRAGSTATQHGSPTWTVTTRPGVRVLWSPPSPASSEQIAPELYPYGSRGPVGAHYLAAKYNVRWGDLGNDEENE